MAAILTRPILETFGVLTTPDFGGRHLDSDVGQCQLLLYVIALNSANSKTHGLPLYQKLSNFMDAFNCYKQKIKIVPV